MARFTPADQSAADIATDPANAEAVADATKTSPVLERLAERLGAIARASTVFGEPVTTGSVTVVPVARVRIGLGGGSGGDPSGGTGEGGGGGAMATPMGWIEITGAGSRFRPLVSRPQRIAGMIGAIAVLAAVILRGRDLDRTAGVRSRFRRR
jgi:uncharacterized spore protein YtfJ